MDIENEELITLDGVMPWGRYKGVKLTDVLEEDPEHVVQTYLNHEEKFADELIEEMINRRIL